jgi:hypothetical protein
MYKLQSEKSTGNNNRNLDKTVQKHSKTISALTDNRNITTNLPVQMTTGQPLQRVDDALLQKADGLITALTNNPTTVNTAELKATLLNLQEKYGDEFDDQYLNKWTGLNEALEANVIPVLTNLIRPLLAHVSNSISTKLKGDTPAWVRNLPNIAITEGEGIAGGLAVGQDAILSLPPPVQN